MSCQEFRTTLTLTHYYLAPDGALASKVVQEIQEFSSSYSYLYGRFTKLQRSRKLTNITGFSEHPHFLAKHHHSKKYLILSNSFGNIFATILYNSVDHSNRGLPRFLPVAVCMLYVPGSKTKLRIEDCSGNLAMLPNKFNCLRRNI